MTQVTIHDGQTPDDGDLLDFVEQLAQLAQQGETKALMEGTFAMYPMADGGIMFVTNATDGPLAGVHHHRIPPSLMRAAALLMRGGGRMAALKALTGIGGRKAIGGKHD